MSEWKNLIDTTGKRSLVIAEFADLLQEVYVTGEEAMTACGDKEELAYPLFREWGL
jgi:hypothetical protein